MKKEKKLSQKLRSWHRDLGYLVIGITIIYSITGIILSFRDLHLFEKEYVIKTQIEDLGENHLVTFIYAFDKNGVKSSLPEHVIKKSKIDKIKLLEDNDFIIKYEVSRSKDMKSITYDKDTKEAVYSISAYPGFIKPFIDAHKSMSTDKWAWLALSYSLILLFLAISAIFMLKGKYGFKQRGIYLTGLGILIVAVFLYI